MNRLLPLLAVALAGVPLSCAEPTGETGDGTDGSDEFDAVPEDAAGADADVESEAADDAGTDEGTDFGTDADADADADAASGCVSGAPGTLAVRFQWEGSGAGSTAYVSYEANDLPDTSRWHVTAASRSIGYTPPYDDIYLGEGGLRLDGTAFIDVELSTVGLSVIDGVTLAIYGRSFATTTSGSFSWQTFDGTGAAPTNLVSNSVPYEWYGADATDAFSPGDSGVLLRIYPGPSSDALIVNRVEVCFDAR